MPVTKFTPPDIPLLASKLPEPLRKAGGFVGQLISDLIGAEDPMSGAYPTPLASVVKPIKVLHASPHKFDKFDMTKIGTGEGHQMYGHGIYTAENPKVARRYMEQFANKSGVYTYDRDNPYQSGIKVVSPQGKSIIAQDDWLDALFARNPKKVFEKAASRYEGLIDPATSSVVQTDKVLKDLANKNAYIAQSPAQLYRAEISAPIDRMLDLDSSLPDQPPAVMDALKDFYGSKLWDSSITPHQAGLNALKDIGNEMSPAKAAEFLKYHGIPGARYLDQFSRQGTGKTRNYVTWDDDAINLLERLTGRFEKK